MDDIKLRGPILTLTMQQLVDGQAQHGHNFGYLIDQISDDIDDFAEYHVRLEDGNFVVYYLTNDDIQERDQDRYRVGYAIGNAAANRAAEAIKASMKETISTDAERDGFLDAVHDILGNLE